MKEEIYFVTSSLEKTLEAGKLLDMPLKQAAIELDELQTLDYQRLISSKLYQAYSKLKSPVIVEDTWLSLDALGRFPGPFIKFLLEEAGPEGICSMAGERRGATATSYLGYYDGARKLICEGTVKGRISQLPRGTRGFGWDSVFIPEGSRQTFAEMTAAEKNAVSMRHQAADALRKELKIA